MGSSSPAGSSGSGSDIEEMTAPRSIRPGVTIQMTVPEPPQNRRYDDSELRGFYVSAQNIMEVLRDDLVREARTKPGDGLVL